MDVIEQQQEHRWLQQMAGNWTYESEVVMGPDKPPMKSSGTESVRAIGGFWIVAEAQGTMPDGKPSTMVITAGYDLDKKKFVATWFGSMMTKLWVYECSKEGNTLNMDAEGPSMTGDGTTALYRDSMEIVDADLRTFRSQMRNPDGSWMQFLTMHYRRVQ
jgi:hypothetical protein